MVTECFSPLASADEVRGDGVGCAGEKRELLKVSGENEQLQAFLKMIWCKGQCSVQLQRKAGWSNGDGNN